MDTDSGAYSGQERLAEAFAELVETTVGEFDVHELLQVLADRCVDVLDVSASGLLLANGGGLRMVVASNERAELLELFQIQHDEGPCLDSYRSGEAIVAEAVDGGFDRWPRFARACVDPGFSSIIAVPLRVTGKVMGTLNLFGTTERPALNQTTARVAQAMAHVAAIAIEQDRISRERATLIVQLETALESRVTIEQAKGMLANHLDIDLNEAFGRLRHRARSSRRLLSEVAEEAVLNRGRDYTSAGD
ncbi:MAG TPA: GAF and ANTAR domain-containing protein [Nocardioides sp.]|nr:GAF and ANTAR domain-containing protein [Nocardioides sp.]